MPGVNKNNNSFGYNCEIGKMAFFNDDLHLDNFNFNLNSMEAFANKLLESDTMDELDNFLSPPPSSSSSPSRDSDLDLLPDLETPMEFLKYFDTNVDPLLAGMTSFTDNTLIDGECSAEKRQRKVSCSKDPFMGHRDDYQEFISGVDSPLGSDSILGQLPLLENLPNSSPSQTTYFTGWGHTPDNDDDDEPLLSLGNGNNNGASTSYIECEEADGLPDTPSSYSGTITGDDSDVDIETIPDTPQSIELCGYSSSNDDLSPSPIPHGHKVSILQRCSTIGSSSSKSLLRYGVSSSASLAENLMSGRSISGTKKRKHKEKHSTKTHTTTQHTTTYHFNHPYYPTGNSVNFHDYAMNPESAECLDTAQPTVPTTTGNASSSSTDSNTDNTKQRLYKRKHINPLDLSDKEKQNHHNQLERNRRQKLADLFIDLRDEVPTISQQSKASKVMILNQATSYIADLQRLQRRQEESLARELHRKEVLKSQLRRIEASLSLQ